MQKAVVHMVQHAVAYRYQTYSTMTPLLSLGWRGNRLTSFLLRSFITTHFLFSAFLSSISADKGKRKENTFHKTSV